MEKAIKLFIPGPVEVSQKTRNAMAGPMIGHRSSDFKALYQSVLPRLQTLFQTQELVFLSTSSAWGVMEGAIRNLVKKGVLNCMCGAFSDKWFDVSKRCGKNAGTLQVEWGREIGRVVRKYPEVMFIVDTVSSFSALPVPMDELGIDLMVTGSQKALALPPGLSLFGASKAAIA